eukprot:811082-Karenia_brevis.AAC.1
MDSYGDHALVCGCNGDRTVRHNALRNAVCAEASVGNMSPEREKAGLLPARPSEDGAPHAASEDEVAEYAQTRRARGRRPADIYLPRGIKGVPMALDFACTSGMRAHRLRDAGINPEA